MDTIVQFNINFMETQLNVQISQIYKFFGWRATEGRIEKIGPQPAKQIGVRPGPADPRDLFVVRDLIGSY